ncbi:MAG: DUF2937 family protein [Panacagrimonas sp.]
MMIGWALDKLIFAMGFVTGGTLPGFLAQYRQRLGGRLDQLQEDLAHFESIAAQQFDGDLQQLIAHHRASNDTTFRAEGEAVASMATQLDQYSQAYASMDGGAFGQTWTMVSHWDQALIQSVWADFVPAMAYSLDGLVMALCGGFLASLLFGAPIALLKWRGRRLRYRKL